MRRSILAGIICLYLLALPGKSFSQQSDELELTVDASSAVIPLPSIFKPNIDLSGRGLHSDTTWPQCLAAKEALETWQKEIGFKGLFRLQYNLWEISHLAKDKEAKAKILANYENVIKSVSDSGGIVILDIFGTPDGMGKILDKKSAPVDMAAFKDLIKDTVKILSCEKKYNIWYEIWNAPDLEGFFLGRQQEYLNLYRTVSESIKELEAQYKMHIFVGGPGSSWWFHNLEGNTAFTPEKSLIYELIKFCYQNHLKLDFIAWHGFSSDPKAEKEISIYNKNAVELVRDWLSYFSFDRDTPLFIDEWNYDRDANLLPERQEKSYISASFIPSRIKNMYEAGINNQVYFSLEDFQKNKEGVTRNVGVFYFDGEQPQDKKGWKASYTVFKMLKELGQDMFTVKLNDEFVGVLAAKSEDKFTILIYNYIDPEIVRDSLSSGIAGLNPAERKFLLNVIRSDRLLKIASGRENIEVLHTTSKVKSLLRRAQELGDKARKFEDVNRNIKIILKNIKGDYFYRRFTTDQSCNLNCEFKPATEKEVALEDSFQEELSLSPYSVNLIVLEKKPALPEVPNTAVTVNSIETANTASVTDNTQKTNESSQ